MAAAKRKVVEMPKALQEQVNKIAAPSMVPEMPQEVIPPPPKEEEIPMLGDLVKDIKDYLTLKQLIEEDLPWKRQEAEAKKARKRIETQLKNLLGKHQVGRAAMDGVTISYYSSSRSSLDRELLMRNGVTMNQIIAGTKSSTSYTLKLSEGKEEEDE